MSTPGTKGGPVGSAGAAAPTLGGAAALSKSLNYASSSSGRTTGRRPKREPEQVKATAAREARYEAQRAVGRQPSHQETRSIKRTTPAGTSPLPLQRLSAQDSNGSGALGHGSSSAPSSPAVKPLDLRNTATRTIVLAPGSQSARTYADETSGRPNQTDQLSLTADVIAEHAVAVARGTLTIPRTATASGVASAPRGSASARGEWGLIHRSAVNSAKLTTEMQQLAFDPLEVMQKEMEALGMAEPELNNRDQEFASSTKNLEQAKAQFQTRLQLIRERERRRTNDPTVRAREIADARAFLKEILEKSSRYFKPSGMEVQNAVRGGLLCTAKEYPVVQSKGGSPLSEQSLDDVPDLDDPVEDEAIANVLHRLGKNTTLSGASATEKYLRMAIQSGSLDIAQKTTSSGQTNKTIARSQDSRRRQVQLSNGPEPGDRSNLVRTGARILGVKPTGDVRVVEPQCPKSEQSTDSVGEDRKPDVGGESSRTLVLSKPSNTTSELNATSTSLVSGSQLSKLEPHSRPAKLQFVRQVRPPSPRTERRRIRQQIARFGISSIAQSPWAISDFTQHSPSGADARLLAYGVDARQQSLSSRQLDLRLDRQLDAECDFEHPDEDGLMPATYLRADDAEEWDPERADDFYVDCDVEGTDGDLDYSDDEGYDTPGVSHSDADDEVGDLAGSTDSDTVDYEDDGDDDDYDRTTEAENDVAKHGHSGSPRKRRGGLGSRRGAGLQNSNRLGEKPSSALDDDDDDDELDLDDEETTWELLGLGIISGSALSSTLKRSMPQKSGQATAGSVKGLARKGQKQRRLEMLQRAIGFSDLQHQTDDQSEESIVFEMCRVRGIDGLQGLESLGPEGEGGSQDGLSPPTYGSSPNQPKSPKSPLSPTLRPQKHSLDDFQRTRMTRRGLLESRRSWLTLELALAEAQVLTDRIVNRVFDDVAATEPKSLSHPAPSREHGLDASKLHFDQRGDLNRRKRVDSTNRAINEKQMVVAAKPSAGRGVYDPIKKFALQEAQHRRWLESIWFFAKALCHARQADLGLGRLQAATAAYQEHRYAVMLPRMLYSRKLTCRGGLLGPKSTQVIAELLGFQMAAYVASVEALTGANGLIAQQDQNGTIEEGKTESTPDKKLYHLVTEVIKPFTSTVEEHNRPVASRWSSIFDTIPVTRVPKAIPDFLLPVTTLDLSNNRLGDTGLTVLATALAHLPFLVHLDLSGNMATSLGLAPVFRALRHLPALETLDVSSDTASGGGAMLIGPGITAATELALLLKNARSLRRLDLKNVGLGLTGPAVTCFAEGLAHARTLQELDLSNNDLSAECIRTICGALVYQQRRIEAESKDDAEGNTAVGSKLDVPVRKDDLPTCIGDLAAVSGLPVLKKLARAAGSRLARASTDVIQALKQTDQELRGSDATNEFPASERLDDSTDPKNRSERAAKPPAAESGPDSSKHTRKPKFRPTCLKVLNLSGNGFRSPGALFLSILLRGGYPLQSLRVRRCDIGFAGFCLLLDAISQPVNRHTAPHPIAMPSSLNEYQSKPFGMSASPGGFGGVQFGQPAPPNENHYAYLATQLNRTEGGTLLQDLPFAAADDYHRLVYLQRLDFGENPLNTKPSLSYQHECRPKHGIGVPPPPSASITTPSQAPSSPTKSDASKAANHPTHIDNLTELMALVKDALISIDALNSYVPSSFKYAPSLKVLQLDGCGAHDEFLVALCEVLQLEQSDASSGREFDSMQGYGYQSFSYDAGFRSTGGKVSGKTAHSEKRTAGESTQDNDASRESQSIARKSMLLSNNNLRLTDAALAGSTTLSEAGFSGYIGSDNGRTSLTHLMLAKNNFKLRGAEALARYLSHARDLVSLNVSQNPFGSLGTALILLQLLCGESDCCPNLRSLRLVNVGLDQAEFPAHNLLSAVTIDKSVLQPESKPIERRAAGSIALNTNVTSTTVPASVQISNARAQHTDQISLKRGANRAPDHSSLSDYSVSVNSVDSTAGKSTIQEQLGYSGPKVKAAVIQILTRYMEMGAKATSRGRAGAAPESPAWLTPWRSRLEDTLSRGTLSGDAILMALVESRPNIRKLGISGNRLSFTTQSVTINMVKFARRQYLASVPKQLIEKVRALRPMREHLALVARALVSSMRRLAELQMVQRAAQESLMQLMALAPPREQRRKMALHALRNIARTRATELSLANQQERAQEVSFRRKVAALEEEIRQVERERDRLANECRRAENELRVQQLSLPTIELKISEKAEMLEMHKLKVEAAVRELPKFRRALLKFIKMLESEEAARRQGKSTRGIAAAADGDAGAAAGTGGSKAKDDDDDEIGGEDLELDDAGDDDVKPLNAGGPGQSRG